MGSVSIPLHSRKYPGLFAIVDEADYPLVSGYRWQPHIVEGMVYARADVPGSNVRRRVYLHRLVLGVGSELLVDHRDFNGLNCCRENLREATKRQNQCHQRTPCDNTSGYKGVSRHGERWRAYIVLHGKQYHAGVHDTREEAARAHDRKAVELHGEFAYLNFPMEN